MDCRGEKGLWDTIILYTQTNMPNKVRLFVPVVFDLSLIYPTTAT